MIDNPIPNRWTYGPDSLPSAGHAVYVAHGPGLCGGVHFYDEKEAMRFCNRRFLSPADFNLDGREDSQDFFDFLACFYADQGSHDWYRSEWTGDGVIDSQDFLAFMADFAADGGES